MNHARFQRVGGRTGQRFGTLKTIERDARIRVTPALRREAAAAIQASASPQGVPFRGTLEGAETFEAAFPDLTVDGDGVGHATHHGRFTATWCREGSQLDGSANATYEFTAANRDKLFIESVGQADLSMLPNIDVVETGTITGGTGRFEGATGTLAIERIVVSEK